MRIVVHGQQAFGKAVLERLLERGENVVAVCCAPTKEGKPEDPLAVFAREKGLPVHQPTSWKTPEALVSTPAGVRAAGDYWTFDRMDRAVPRLPDVLDPVTLEPITMDKADPTRSYR